MYRPEEIQAAVEKLVRPSIRRPVDALGARRTDVSFDDLQEAAAGVFLLHPNAPYRVIFLGAQRLREALAAEVTLLQQVLDAIEAAGRHTTPITDLSSLSNATAALNEIEAVSANRAGASRNIARTAAYQRFDANVAAFLAGPAANIRAGGAIVQTPEQARRALPGLVADLRERHVAIVRAATYLAGAIDDYASVNLPSLVARGTLGRSRSVLTAHTKSMATVSSDARLEKLRAVTLDVLATRAVLKAFGSFSGPSEFLPLSGVGRPYSDATHLATPAALTSEKFNAYAIMAGENVLEIALDEGNPPIALILPPSTMASLDGGTPESEGSPGGFLIGDGTNPIPPGGGTAPKNNKFVLDVSAGRVSTTYTANLTVSASLTALTPVEQIAQDLNAALPPGVRARAVFVPRRYAGTVDVAASSGPETSATASPATDFGAIGVLAGDLLSVSAGPNEGLFRVQGIASPRELRIARDTGVFLAQAAAPCEIGPRGRRLRIACVDPKSQLPAATTLTVRAPDDVARAGEATLGFVPGLASECSPSTPGDVTDRIREQTAALAVNVQYLPLVEGTTGRASRTNPFQVAFFTYTGSASAVFQGSVLTLVSPVLTPDVVAVGQRIVLRAGANPGLSGTITTVAQGTLTATMVAPGASSPKVLFDVGPDLAPQAHQTVRVTGGPNQGDYPVRGPGDTPLDIALRRSLLVVGQGAESLTFSASLGNTAIVFAATSRTTASRVEVRGAAASLFFVAPATANYGTTAYVRVPQPLRGVSVGDLLEVYADDYQSPSQLFRIEDAESQAPILRISPEIRSNTTLRFGEEPPPFARVRFARGAAFATLERRLRTWLALPSSNPSFFTDLHRYINPLTASANPTATQVGAARDRLAALLADLTLVGATTRGAAPTATLEFSLTSYAVEPVAALDTLLRSYKEKGADRASDLLLQGQFSAFFGLSVDDASYAGAMQARMREVVQQDVSLRKTDRADVVQGRSIVTAASPDYEQDVSDSAGQ
ncbi:hypothetical protein LVJ94_35450 [Pendulispora rubella]|uniref:Uncharacterized protein n=1 Tax=Pendulispora rubella TaxID=2741070 RepID=A0ABZ2KVW1_9BACT